MSTDIASPPVTEPSGPVKYRIGTLEYTKRSLIIVSFWLLWGDFCFTIMEQVFPSIVPLSMSALKSPGWLIGLVTATIPAVFNFFVCPWVSYKSDRHRGKWGRRIPFLLFPTPFIAAILILMGFSKDIGIFLHKTMLSGSHYSEATIILVLIAVLAASFQYFNMFVGSVYYYLFNDVIPEQFLGRFMSLFRVVGCIAGAGYQFFVYKYIETDAKWIWLGAGLLYLVVFTLMCLKVKEGEYPPPPENVDGKEGMLSSLKTYFVECFSHPFYWFFFLASTSWALTANCLGSFNLLLQRTSLGIPMEKIGFIGGISLVISAIMLYPMGMWSDRRHPVRIMLWAIAGLVILTPFRFIYLFTHFTPVQAYHYEFAFLMVTLPLSTMYSASSLPLFMRMLPMERYGQFCSAEAMLRSLVVIVAGVAVGGFFDVVKKIAVAHGMSDVWQLRFVPVLMWLCYIGALLFMIRVYKYYHEFGGDAGYKPPAVGVAAKKKDSEAAAVD